MHKKSPTSSQSVVPRREDETRKGESVFLCLTPRARHSCGRPACVRARSGSAPFPLQGHSSGQSPLSTVHTWIGQSRGLTSSKVPVACARRGKNTIEKGQRFSLVRSSTTRTRGTVLTMTVFPCPLLYGESTRVAASEGQTLGVRSREWGQEWESNLWSVQTRRMQVKREFNRPGECM